MKKLQIITIALLLLASTLNAGKGKIRVASDHQGAYVYVDGKKKAMTGEGFTSILLDEGEYVIKVVKELNNKYQEVAIKQIFIGEDSSVKITLNPEIVEPTVEYAQKLTILDIPKLARWKRKENTVVDTKLMLEWQDNINSANIAKQWKDAKKYCENLSLNGYQNWRLPTYDELYTIIDHERYYPAIIPSFQNTASYIGSTPTYWTSRRINNPGTLARARQIRFTDGYSHDGSILDTCYIRCVRARQSL